MTAPEKKRTKWEKGQPTPPHGLPWASILSPHTSDIWQWRSVEQRSYRDIAALLGKRGVCVSHTSVARFLAARKRRLAETTLPPSSVLPAATPNPPWIQKMNTQTTTLSPETIALMDEAGDPSTRPAVLADFATHSDFAIREAVASNPATPPDVLTALSNDEQVKVRCALIKNQMVSPAVQAALANDTEYVVLLALAESHLTSPEVLVTLLGKVTPRDANDGSSNAEPDPIIEAVAGNPRTAAATLKTIYAQNERNKAYCCRILFNPSAPSGLIADITRAYWHDGEILSQVTLALNRPPQVLASLARHECSWVRVRVASNPHLPITALNSLAVDPLAGCITSSIRSDPSSPPVEWVKGSNLQPWYYDFWEIKRTVQRNPSTPAEIRAALEQEIRFGKAEGAPVHPAVLTPPPFSGAKKTIVFVAGKGGSGRTTIALALAEYYQAKGVPCIAYDGCPVNPTLNRFWPDAQITNTAHSKGFEPVINNLEAPNTVAQLIDLSAAGQQALQDFAGKFDMTAVTNEHGSRLTLVFVLGPSVDSVRALQNIVEYWHDKFAYIIVRNNFNQVSNDEWQLWENSQTRAKLRALGAPVIEAPNLDGNTFAAADRGCLSWGAAARAPHLTCSTRSRLECWTEKLTAEFDKVKDRLF